MGRILPDDIAGMTRDQFLTIWLDRESVAGSTRMTEADAVASGYIKPGKTAYELAKERAAEQAAQAGNRQRRRRRQAVTGG